MNAWSWGRVLGVLLVYAPAGLATEKALAPDLSGISDPTYWNIVNAEASTAIEHGRSVVHLKPKAKTSAPSNIGLALVQGLEFAEGIVELDLRGKGKSEASFLGVAFHVGDGNTFEAVYFRPFNFTRKDELHRAHGVQYVAWPDHTWERLRKGQPGRYEAAVTPVPDPTGWFRARIEITKPKVRVWVDEAKDPCLVVDRLASREKGMVGLWVDSKEGAFRDLRIVPVK